MRREERVTVQGPVKEQQPDGMSHRGVKVVAKAVSGGGKTGGGTRAGSFKTGSGPLGPGGSGWAHLFDPKDPNTGLKVTTSYCCETGVGLGTGHHDQHREAVKRR